MEPTNEEVIANEEVAAPEVTDGEVAATVEDTLETPAETVADEATDEDEEEDEEVA